MFITELYYNFNIAKLYEECYDLIENVGLHENHNQISLKHTNNLDNGNFWYQGTGSLTYSFKGQNIPNEREIKLNQTDFIVLHEKLSNTYLAEVYETLSTKYIIGRYRLMGLGHKKCTSMHTDKSKRIHIPISTNENCLMIIENELFHMPANGNAYLTDTTKPHTALNANHSFLRLHLLLDLVV